VKKLTILLLCVALASCGSKSGKKQPENRNVFFRAQHTWISTVSFDRLVSNNIEIISADSAFHVGDTITVNDSDYIIRERVK
jgi:hypothetical protein